MELQEFHLLEFQVLELELDRKQRYKMSITKRPSHMETSQSVYSGMKYNRQLSRVTGSVKEGVEGERKRDYNCGDRETEIIRIYGSSGREEWTSITSGKCITKKEVPFTFSIFTTTSRSPEPYT